MNFQYSAEVNSITIKLSKMLDETFRDVKYTMCTDYLTYNLTYLELINYFTSLDNDVKCDFLSVRCIMFSTSDWVVFVDIGTSHSLSDNGKLSFWCQFTTRTYNQSRSMVEHFDGEFKSREIEQTKTTNWASLTPKGEVTYTTMDLKAFDNFYPEFYPYINNGDVNQWIKDFIDSSSNVLILTGDPGLGKSSIINHIINYAKWNSVVAYDPQVMMIDDFYIDFISNAHRDVMVLEDADLLLESRAEAGNKTMAKILNVSDGVIKVNKKFIFTANIKKTDDIDSALTRPGRCFDIVQFRPLTLDEAQIASDAIGKPLKETSKNSYSVAEIYNSRINRENVVPIRKFGFV